MIRVKRIAKTNASGKYLLAIFENMFPRNLIILKLLRVSGSELRVKKILVTRKMELVTIDVFLRQSSDI